VVLSDAAWARIEPLLPPVNKAMGRPSRPHRLVEGVEGVVRDVNGCASRHHRNVPWRTSPGFVRFGHPSRRERGRQVLARGFGLVVPFRRGLAPGYLDRRRFGWPELCRRNPSLS